MRISTEDVTWLFAKEILSQRIWGRDLPSTPQESQPLQHSISSVQFSRSVVSNSFWPHGLQHTWFPYPSPTPRACSNACPLSQWSHPIFSSSVVPFSSCLQSFPTSGSFPMSQFFALGGQSIGASASASVLLGLSRVFLQHHSSKASILQCSAFFTVQLYGPIVYGHIHTRLLERP